MANLNLYSWNVNGLRAVHRKGELMKFIKDKDPDILCLQEIKANAEQLPEKVRHMEGYECFYNSAEKKGYSGTAVYTKVSPHVVTYGLGVEKHDQEGRVISMEFDDFWLVNVYVPNAKPDLSRLDYREVWDADFRKYVSKLGKEKPVVVCGDMNVAHKEIDLARPESNKGNAGFTDEERAGISKLFDAGFLDSFRMFNEEGENYTWWTYRGGARDRNVGWRIDYFIVSKKLEEKVKDASIEHEVMGSDHCPVGLELASG